MGKVNSFEDLIVWQNARTLCRDIYAVTSEAGFSKDFALRDQIRRSAISITSNIAEGFDREGKQEFIRFLLIAKSFCSEVRSQLYIAFDLSYITREKLIDLVKLCVEINKMISGLIVYLRKYQVEGPFYLKEPAYDL